MHGIHFDLHPSLNKCQSLVVSSRQPGFNILSIGNEKKITLETTYVHVCRYFKYFSNLNWHLIDHADRREAKVVIFISKIVQTMS